MFALTKDHRFFLFQGVVDMRNGIKGLYKIIKSQDNLSPLSGDVFIFISRNRINIKLLKWDKDGFVLYHKRLEGGTFEIPKFDISTNTHTLSWDTFYSIMQGINISSIKYRKRFVL